MDIPYADLGISEAVRPKVDPATPKAARLLSAHPGVGDTVEETLAALYVLAVGGDDEVRDAAAAACRRVSGVREALSNRMHPKLLEWITMVRPEPALDERIVDLRIINDETARRLARRAHRDLAERLCDDHSRLISTPEVLVELWNNPESPVEALERARAYLRMEQCLPALPEVRGGPVPAATPAPAPVFDLEAEVEAALAGRASPMLEQKRKLEMFDVDHVGGGVAGFSFDFKDDDEFSLDMLEDADGADAEAKLNLEKRIAAMPPGKKIKLAYLGNKEVRSILIRDRNKQVGLAVVKSGRLTDAEVVNHAANRNLSADVLREIAVNKEWVRKYPVKVALVNNPRVPISVCVGFVAVLQKKDLEALARNRNVSSVLSGTALKMSKEKGP